MSVSQKIGIASMVIGIICVILFGVFYWLWKDDTEKMNNWVGPFVKYGVPVGQCLILLGFILLSSGYNALSVTVVGIFSILVALFGITTSIAYSWSTTKTSVTV